MLRLGTSITSTLLLTRLAPPPPHHLPGTNRYAGQATEVSDFPLPLYDTHESIAAIKEEGGKLAETLLPAPEGATAEVRASSHIHAEQLGRQRPLWVV